MEPSLRGERSFFFGLWKELLASMTVSRSVYAIESISTNWFSNRSIMA